MIFLALSNMPEAAKTSNISQARKPSNVAQTTKTSDKPKASVTLQSYLATKAARPSKVISISSVIDRAQKAVTEKTWNEWKAKAEKDGVSDLDAAKKKLDEAKKMAPKQSRSNLSSMFFALSQLRAMT